MLMMCPYVPCVLFLTGSLTSGGRSVQAQGPDGSVPGAAYLEMLSHLQAGNRTALGQKAVLDAGQAYPPFAYTPQGHAFEKRLRERK